MMMRCHELKKKKYFLFPTNMQFRDVTLAYGHRLILSGSGKTSLMRTLIGQLPPVAGKVFVDDTLDVYRMGRWRMAAYRRTMGVIFQDYKLLPNKTVRENVAFAMEVCRYPQRLIRERVPEVLSQVGLLEKQDRLVPTLSGGEAQRVAIARALIHRPSVIIADEPTGNLDHKNALEIMRILEDLNRQGKTIIMATHDANIVNAAKKRVISLGDQKILSDIPHGSYTI
jgi:cell division transport system ATP-binding protein